MALRPYPDFSLDEHSSCPIPTERDVPACPSSQPQGPLQRQLPQPPSMFTAPHHMALKMTKLWWEPVPTVTVLLLNPLWVTLSDLQIQSQSVPRQLRPLEEHVREAYQWVTMRGTHRPQRLPCMLDTHLCTCTHPPLPPAHHLLGTGRLTGASHSLVPRSSSRLGKTAPLKLGSGFKNL